MLNAGHDFAFGRAIAGKFVGDHDAWRSHLLLQQLAQQPLRRLFVASALDQNIEHDPGLVHGTPQPVLHTGDLEHEASGAGQFHPRALSGRVEDWRASWSRHPDHTTFPAPSTSQRSMRISRTARPHLLHVEAYGTYHAGATFDPSRRTR